MVELKEEFIYYCEHRKVLPYHYLKKYVKKILDIIDARDYVEEINIEELDIEELMFENYIGELTLGNYEVYFKKIDVYYNQVTNFILNQNPSLYEKDFAFRVNLCIISTITHECIHARQCKLIDNNDGSLAAKIFMDCAKARDEYEDIYETVYKFYPLETNAKILTEIYIAEFLNTLSPAEEVVSNNRIAIGEILTNYMLNDEEYIIPTEKFYFSIGREKRYKKITSNINLSCYNKMLLGLSISNDFICSLLDIKKGKTEIFDIKKYLKTK